MPSLHDVDAVRLAGWLVERTTEVRDRRLRRAAPDRAFRCAAERLAHEGVAGRTREQEMRGRLLGRRPHVHE